LNCGHQVPSLAWADRDGALFIPYAKTKAARRWLPKTL
jgi:hypothetical protein